MSAVLAVALFGPVLLLVMARAVPTAAAARRWTSRAALLVAAAWLLVLLADPDATFGRFGARAAPAAIGTWLLVAAIGWPARRLPAALATVTAGIAVGGLSLLAGRGDRSDAIGALALATVAALVAARSEDDGGALPAVVAVVGAAGMALGIARDIDPLVVWGAVAVVVSAGIRVRRVGSVLLPAALVLGAAAAHGAGVAVLLALVACALARRPVVSLGLWALASAASGAPVLLLGGAAVVAAVVLHPIVAAVALPGAAVLAATVADSGGRWGLALAGLAALTVAQLWRPPDDTTGAASPATVTAIGLGLWLLLAPETWRDAPGLEAWGTGVLVALVAAVVGAFLVASFTEATFTVPQLEVADPLRPAGDPRWAWRVAPIALAVLGICGATLVASTVS